ncbi:LysM domain-containing protein [Frankia sp. AgB32]|uniref:LysM peptidoglycan-binding domain-containing protein n=1 Tax=Frankia sp. AgB32 TaxID=631119 RepID=UPI00200D422C|nr:LysM domain-containing protein [Frankia sp. AgB32]MCK9896829.1 LysM peptidoglycan-binding domain-containing protein [Frankia sp. AgB32]
MPAAGATTGGAADGDIVVLRGDSLWTIAARHLGANATQEQISAEWHRWWSANMDVIGHDPNMILPGQRLTPPSGP